MAKKFLLFVALISIATMYLAISGRGLRKKDLIENRAPLGKLLTARFREVQEKRVHPRGPIKLTNDRGQFLKLSPDGKEVIYYLPESGQIKSISIENRNQPGWLLAKIEPGLKNIVWSPDGTRLAADNGNGFVFYRLLPGHLEKIESKIKDPVFSKTNQVAYISFDPQNASQAKVEISNLETKTPEVSLKTRFFDWQISWINHRLIGLISGSQQKDSVNLFTWDIQNENLRKILKDRRGLEVLWSPNGRKLIYSATNLNDFRTKTSQKNFNNLGLYFSHLAPFLETNLNISVQASNCTWSKDEQFVYCLKNDQLILINTDNPQAPSQIVAADPALATIEEFLVLSKENYLVFKNTQTGKLYGLFLTALTNGSEP